MSENKKEENYLLIGVLKLLTCLWFGLRKLWEEKGKNYSNVFAFFVLMFGICFRHRFLISPVWGIHRYMPTFINKLIYFMPWSIIMILMTISFGSVFLLFYGIKEFKLIQEYQRKLEHSGIKNAEGRYPQVIAVNQIDEYKTTLVIRSVGIGIDKYHTRKGDLESSLAEMINTIVSGANPQIVIFNLAKRKLVEKTEFPALEKYLKTPYSFIVGESMKGPVIKSIESLPHMLIAGTTGGGKSVFFKQMLLGLLKTSPHLQMYLVDLKRGVEMKDFSTLPNVRIAKTEEETVLVLERLKNEMDRRFVYMEEHGFKEIDPERDKMDKIIIGIDEASVIYTRTRGNSTKSHLTNKARELTDEIAKLARAAGIHLILATQKVSKETIDTKVQENIGGRICFRVNTMVNSLTVLGNKKAYELPDIKGRAVWSTGNEFVEVQAPFISEEELAAEIEELESSFVVKERNIFGEMIEVSYLDEKKSDDVPNKATEEMT